MPSTARTGPRSGAPGAGRSGPSAVRRPSRLLVLLLAGGALVGGAAWLRSTPWLREPLLRGRTVPELEAAVRSRPDDALARYYLAKGYYLSRRFPEAREAYEAAARRDPGSARTQLGLGLTLAEIGRNGEAKLALERALRLDARLAWAEYTLGKLLWLEGDAAGALPHVRRAAELDPRSDQSWYGLGVCYSQLGRHQEAIDAFRKAVERQETSAKYHTALGELLVYRGHVEEGRAHYERALALSPGDPSTSALLGAFYLRHATEPGRLDRAEALLKQATWGETRNPAHVWFDLGQVYMRKRQYGAAVIALRESVRRDARDERAYYALANAYRRTGNPAGAAAAEAKFRRLSALHIRMQELKARVSHDPEDAARHLDLARVYRDLGLVREAARHYAAASGLKPRDAAIADEWKRLIQAHSSDSTEPRPRDFALPAPR
jgi:tetratricopeptide (TPR) repeat protein